FLFHRSYLNRNSKKILMVCCIFVLLFSSFGAMRFKLTEYFSYVRVAVSAEEISLVPTELFTGLLSHHSIEHGVHVEGISFLQRIIPNTISTKLGLGKTIPYTQQIALESFYTSGRSVYTVPYLSDLYFSVGQNFFYFFIFN